MKTEGETDRQREEWARQVTNMYIRNFQQATHKGTHVETNMAGLFQFKSCQIILCLRLNRSLSLLV